MRFMMPRRSDQNTEAGVSSYELHLAARRTSNEDLRRAGVLLRTIQGLLALLFLFAGGMKLVVPLETLAEQSPLPGLFMRFIGVCEVLGALGLIFPRLLRLWPGLTPLAAAGLVIIMIGATVVTVAGGDVAPALVPLVVGLLAAFVAYRRWRLVRHRGSAHRSVLLPTG